MQYRTLGTTGWKVSEISFGAWAIGSAWGSVSDEDALAALHTAIESGVNFIDTADVYGDGLSEQRIARALKDHPGEEIHVVTKAGRRLNPHTAEGYNLKNLTAFVERSLKNLETESLDLVQLHCPPFEVYYMQEVFDALDRLVRDGKIKHYGVSVEKVEEAMKALEFPNVRSVQIIFNMFRQRPAERFLEMAKAKKVGILARVPLASGLLSGKMSAKTTFAEDDHRSFNRNGEAFDVGETFAGIPFEIGLEAVEELRDLVPEGATLAQLALRWILMFDGISCTIPGARNPEQAKSNAAAADLPPLSDETMARVSKLYDTRIRPLVHQRW